jgi:hypothetical protein
MREVVKVFGWLLLLQGLGGLMNTLFGWWPWAKNLIVANHLGFLEGYEVFAAVVIGVLGFVLIAIADSGESSEGSR